MTPARYDAVADFYVSGFDSTGDPATRALLDLLGPVAGLRVLYRRSRRRDHRDRRRVAFRRPFHLVDPAPVLHRRKGHLRFLAARRQLLRRRALAGPGAKVLAAPPGRGQSPDA